MEQDKDQPKTGKQEVREGQENSSILHDKEESDKELMDVTKKDISAQANEEFIDDDANTTKEKD